MKKKTTPKVGKYKLAARTDAPDFRDYVYQPALGTLAPELPPPDKLHVRDQGNSEACTGFGLAAAIDRLVDRANGGVDAPVATVSARMLYEMARR